MPGDSRPNRPAKPISMMAQVEDSGTTAEGVKKSYVVDPSRPPRTKITYLTWTADGLLRHTVYVGLREDKPADEVRKEAARDLRCRPAGVDVKWT